MHTQARNMKKPKEALSKVTPLQWSFSSKDLLNTQPGELVKYLESGRRPRCTKDPITKLVASEPQMMLQLKGQEVHNSPSNGRPVSKTHASTKIPSVQMNNSLPNINHVKAKNGDSLTQRPSKRTKNHQGRTPDFQHEVQRGTVVNSYYSHSAPSSRDSTLRNTQSGSSYMAQKDMLQLFLHSEDRRQLKRHGDSNHANILPFFNSFFVKKDIFGSTEEQYLLKKCQGQLGQIENVSQTKQSLSNGMVPNGVLEDKKVSVVSRCNHNNCIVQLLIGQAGSHEAADIKRASSSNNVQLKFNETFKKYASLQRNCESTPTHISLLLEKPSSTSLQQIRHCTTSHGRPVTESSF